MNHYPFKKYDELKTTVISRDEMELLELRLNEDDIVPAHSIEGVGTAIVLSGQVVFKNEDNEEITANPFDIVQFDPSEKHSLRSLEDSIVYVYRQGK